jgi:competence protein ComEC
LAWITVFDLSKSGILEVTFFDVGQGDAIFIETPKMHQILIDGGPSSAILEKLAKEMPFWDRSIDLIILTHPEYDHMVGLLEVLKRYKVENILWTGVVRDVVEYKEWVKLIKEEEIKEGAKIFIAQASQKIKIQWPDRCNLARSESCSFLEVLYPFENLAGREMKNTNDTSIVAHLVFGENSFLFTGDITKSVEKELSEHYSLKSSDQNPIDSDVLKIAHHGSKTSSSEELLKAATPEIAVIQVGKNNYGHPHPQVLLNLEKFGIEILRTDKDGDIKIVSDGKNLKIKKLKI